MLQRYFDELGRVDCRCSSLLAPDAVLERSEEFAFHPTISALRAYILDDENTSDHHFLITAEPLAGGIFFLSHDGESRVVFENSMNFLLAVRDAGTRGLSVSDLHPDLSPVVSDQASLSHLVRNTLERGARNDLVLSVIPSLDLKDSALLRKLVSDADFFLGEAVAMEIEKRPSIELLPIAALCAEHSHPQVANAGARAVRRIQQFS
jgi:hypothetical protein